MLDLRARLLFGRLARALTKDLFFRISKSSIIVLLYCGLKFQIAMALGHRWRMKSNSQKPTGLEAFLNQQANRY
jgi:hypothetical protein